MRPRGGDDAVSSVVGSLLIAALVTATLVTVRLEFIPVWESGREAAHTRVLERQFLNVKTDVDRQLANATNVPIANVLSLGSEDFSVFRSARLPAEVAFTPTERVVRMSTPSILVLTLNGTSSVGLSESWETITNNEVLDVTRVGSLRINISSIQKENDGDSVLFTVRDKDGRFAGDIRATVVRTEPTYQIKVKTRDATGTVLYDQGIAYSLSGTVSPYWIDALQRDYRFDKVLAATKTPLLLNLTVQNVGGTDLSARYAVSYYKATSNGEVLVGGTQGATQTNYLSTFGGGTLTLKTHNQYFVDQDLVFENGAVVVRQPQGAAFKTDPSMSFAQVGSLTSVVFGLPSLKGTAASTVSTGTVAIRTAPTAGTELVGQAPRFTFEVATAFPSLWEGFWTSKLGATGIGFTRGVEYEVNKTASSATLTLYGTTITRSSTVNDLHIVLRQSDVRVDVKG